MPAFPPRHLKFQVGLFRHLVITYFPFLHPFFRRNVLERLFCPVLHPSSSSLMLYILHKLQKAPSVTFFSPLSQWCYVRFCTTYQQTRRLFFSDLFTVLLNQKNSIFVTHSLNVLSPQKHIGFESESFLLHSLIFK